MTRALPVEHGIGKTIVLVGLGNIGSPLAALLARCAWLRRLVLIDGDGYEARNLEGQEIRVRDVGKPKAEVQAARLREIAPRLIVDAVCRRVEQLPMGRLRGDLIVAAVDSKVTRQEINQLAWRLGIPWVDAGVAPEGCLVRVRPFVPALGGPCLECGWDQRDYDSLTIRRPCGVGADEVGRTGAPAYLGSLAAAMQVSLCEHVLIRTLPAEHAAREWLLDLASRRLHETIYRRNPRCRFDHRTWQIETLPWGPAGVSLAEAFERLGRLTGGAARLHLGPAGRCMIRQWRCRCGVRKQALRVWNRAPNGETRCRRCGEAKGAGGFDVVGDLEANQLSPRDRRQTLARMGFQPGDVLVARQGDREWHFELGKD